MIKLLQAYSITDVLIFLVLFAVALKGVISFFEWAIERLKKVFSKEVNQAKKEQSLLKQLNQQKQKIDQLSGVCDKVMQTMDKLTDKVNMLINSDRQDIKSYITRQHHYFCYRKGWIDDYSLQCCELRYAYYKKQGGNSFIQTFMEDLRKLPKMAPNTQD